MFEICSNQALQCAALTAYLFGMDAEWFKKRQKLLGLTSFDLGEAIGRDRTAISKIINGSQRVTLDQARVLAEKLGVTLAEMVERSGMAGGQVAQALSPGFAESDATAWIPSGMAEAGPVRSVAEALGQRPGVDVWRVKSRAMALAGLLEGDYFLLDTHQSERVKPADVVVAQIYSRNGASTVLRRLEPPVLVAASADPAEGRVHVVDGVNVVIRGKVVAIWRV